MSSHLFFASHSPQPTSFLPGRACGISRGPRRPSHAQTSAASCQAANPMSMSPPGLPAPTHHGHPGPRPAAAKIRCPRPPRQAAATQGRRGRRPGALGRGSAGPPARRPRQPTGHSASTRRPVPCLRQAPVHPQQRAQIMSLVNSD